MNATETNTYVLGNALSLTTASKRAIDNLKRQGDVVSGVAYMVDIHSVDNRPIELWFDREGRVTHFTNDKGETLPTFRPIKVERGVIIHAIRDGRCVACGEQDYYLAEHDEWVITLSKEYGF